MALPTAAEIKEFVASMAVTVLNSGTLPTEYGTLTSTLDSNAKTITTTLVHSFTVNNDAAGPTNIILMVD